MYINRLLLDEQEFGILVLEIQKGKFTLNIELHSPVGALEIGGHGGHGKKQGNK